MKRFAGSFTQQEALPEEAIAAAVEVMRSGRLHRYNVAPGESGAAARLERAYAEWQGVPYCLAVTSGGQAMQIALRAVGVRPGDAVLTNGFTLAPVPGAIAAVGGRPVLVEITEDLVIDLDDLAAKAGQARVLLLSHMRGHLADMDALMKVAEAHDLTVIEDCAHTMGARWNNTLSGNFGRIACFSTQTYKHMNSGEGGFLTSRDPEVMARAVMLSGSYMLYGRHGAAPGPEAFADVALDTPNMSARMDNLRAAILLPQLAQLDANVSRWVEREAAVREELARSPAIRLPEAPAAALRVGSSIQFQVEGVAPEDLLARAAERGVELKWFGAQHPAGFTSAHRSWRYIAPQDLPRTDAILATLMDMRLPLTFSVPECREIGALIVDAVEAR
ncbi:DegT/DnrJ/EryC1/StrS family aminotransferase [Pontivivens ytuae]|uniref:DegT/DnrJ/EryC1/StrS family aminotransferase n=1 Tax=Pontivivens ytuae TaxID=2789856 RepID=A0A7S9QCS0_9RHOB|nr:aminotransferase class I/II-fold pyridoxal phosphate-dependent enzyme [Pontivivens ytuae]QPH54110.1 DegT/DnrJ/EryC1/StrS family aminotransferase [Pontivivens ytuae]